MNLDKLVQFFINSAVAEECRNKGQSLNQFKFERRAKDLIPSAVKCAQHHRSREQHYTEELESAESQLREKGISVDVWDPAQGFNIPVTGHLGSGSIGAPQAQFQANIDPKMLNAVKYAKTKMLEHRNNAERFEKYARAFRCCPADTLVEMTIEDVHTFQLES